MVTGTNEDAVRSYGALEKKDPELAAQVISGEKPLKQAVREAKKPKIQAEHLEAAMGNRPP
jgi:hypothetical protein